VDRGRLASLRYLRIRYRQQQQQQQRQQSSGLNASAACWQTANFALYGCIGTWTNAIRYAKVSTDRRLWSRRSALLDVVCRSGIQSSISHQRPMSPAVPVARDPTGWSDCHLREQQRFRPNEVSFLTKCFQSTLTHCRSKHLYLGIDLLWNIRSLLIDMSATGSCSHCLCS
jgi:hypothetical protein